MFLEVYCCKIQWTQWDLLSVAPTKQITINIVSRVGCKKILQVMWVICSSFHYGTRGSRDKVSFLRSDLPTPNSLQDNHEVL